MLVRLDMDIAALVSKLDARVGKGNYTLFVTFSEMRELMPEDLRKIKVNSDYFSILLYRVVEDEVNPSLATLCISLIFSRF